jgi:hypothetical protein
MPETVAVMLSRNDVVGGLAPTMTYRDDAGWAERRREATARGLQENTELLVELERERQRYMATTYTAITGPQWLMRILRRVGATSEEFRPDPAKFMGERFMKFKRGK